MKAVQARRQEIDEQMMETIKALEEQRMITKLLENLDDEE